MQRKKRLWRRHVDLEKPFVEAAGRFRATRLTGLILRSSNSMSNALRAPRHWTQKITCLAGHRYIFGWDRVNPVSILRLRGIAVNKFRNVRRNCIGGSPDRIGSEVGVAGGGLDLRVAEELADHRQALAGGDRR